jgi:exosortase A
LEESAGRAGQAELSLAWVVAVLVLVLAVYRQTTLSMVDVWRNSTTYSHGFLILPVFLWLVWNRRLTLSRLPIRPYWVGLFGLAGLGLTWLIGDLAAAAEPSQFAVVAMVPVAAATILGAGWVRALAFPFVFLFFAVPFGDSLIPPMMDWTADFTVAALKLSGVPVYREGNNFSIPSGDWSVIEACSGIRYVFACLTVSTLYAWTIYRSTFRRLLFVGCALAIAVVANWIRAYSIVMLAHLSDNQLATGIDDLVYGGVFFGVVMAIVFALGALWRENPSSTSIAGVSVAAEERTADAAAVASGPRRSLAAALAVAATLVVWPLASIGTGRESHQACARIGDIEPRGGWVRVDEPRFSWQPQLRNPSRVQLQTFMKDGRRVSVYLGVFDRPTPDSKLTASVNQLVGSEDPKWKQIERGVAQAHRRGEVIPVRTGTVVGQDARIIAWHWYWVDATLTISSTRAALVQVLARLTGRSETSAWVTIYTTQKEYSASTPLLLEAFLSDMLDSIDQALRAVAAGACERVH